MWIVLSTYNRFDYLRRTIISLRETTFPPNTKLYIVDDCSTDKKVRNLVEKIPRILPELDRVEILCNATNIGPGVLTIRAWSWCFQESPEDKYLFNINSDSIFHPEWMLKLIEAEQSLQDTNHSIGIITAFNTEYENKKPYGHKVQGWLTDKARIKESCGAFGIMVNRDIVPWITKYGQKRKVTPGWDCKMMDECRDRGYWILATDKSYIQHTGISGLHSRPGGVIDIAKDFVGEY